MQLVERHIRIKDKAIEDICFKTARLYNFCNYYKRKSYFGEVEKFGEYELSGLLCEYNQEDFRALPSTTAQQVIRKLFSEWSNFFKAKKDWIKHPSKYSGKPKPPKYQKKNGYWLTIFTKTQCPIKNGYIGFPSKTGIAPIKTKVKKLDQIRIVPQANCFVIEVVYTVKEKKNENLNPKNFLSLDLGLDNFITSINNVGEKPFIVNGKVLKSVNQMYNKGLAKLKSYVGIGTSNRIKKWTHYRNNFIEDKLHKISRFVIHYCEKHNIGTIVIGKNENWKSEINIGRVNNQKFTSIPHSKLIQKLTYKAKLVGINVIIHEESYTSKIDHLAFEPMQKRESYLGKRKRRGLFQSSTKKLINADVNGAIGIARKVFGDSVIRPIIDSGLAFNPYKVNIV